MSTEKKVQRVREARQEGTALQPALSAVELPRSTWYYHQNRKVSYKEKYQWLKPILEEIITENPAYGVRRIKCELQESYGHRVNHKVLRRLLPMWDLSVRRGTRSGKNTGPRAAISAAGSRADLVNGRDEISPFEVSVTDFTELRYDGGAKGAKLMPVLGHETKMVYGWALGPERNSQLALRAWERATETFQNLGIAYAEMIVHHDQDSVYTSFQWLHRLLIEDNVRLSFSMRGAKGNTVMEAFNGNFKHESTSLFAGATDVEQLREIVDSQMVYYNRRRRHSAIGNVSPADYVRRVTGENDKN